MPRGKLMQYATSLAPTYDGIFTLDLAGANVFFAYGPELVGELCDEARFRKVVIPPLLDVAELAGDGLFTARSEDPNWGKAHRVLLPAFGMRSMRTYFPAMLEVAQELVGSWDRHLGEDVEVVDDMTRLTLDTIALTGFGYRFESFRSKELHPFLDAMGRVLTESQARVARLPKTERLYRRQARKFEADIAAMNALVDEVIARRRATGEQVDDLLGLMLEAVDPDTGERLDDRNVRYQILTFLIAGHETTSGLLSFALYQLLRNPHVMAQAYAEVDHVLPGDTVPTYRDMGRLDVLSRILDETLRLWSPAPAFTVAPYENTVLAGRYRLRKNRPVVLLLGALHRDPVAWPDPERFDIDRFLPEVAARRSPHVYKPFGNGARACIGRQFALVEATLALAMVLQRFALEDPYDYQLEVKETLTIKPAGFRLRARRRRPHERLSSGARVDGVEVAPAPSQSAVPGALDLQGAGLALSVLFGSNMGTCEDIANAVVERGSAAGFAVTMRSLDEGLDDLPSEGLLVVVTSTYNGLPPDNGRRLNDAIDEGLFSGPELVKRLGNTHFSLLGCGNTQWVNYQAFPKKVEQALLAAGATPLIPRAEADAAGDFDGAVEKWGAQLVAAVAAYTGKQSFTEEPTTPRYGLQLLDERAVRPSVVPEHAVAMTVISNEELISDPPNSRDGFGEPALASTRRVVLELPAGCSYELGDHLAVFARNDPALVARIAARFDLRPEQIVRLTQHRGRSTQLPVDTPVDVAHLLGEFVELQDVATRADLRLLSGHISDPQVRESLLALSGDTSDAEQSYRSEVLDRHISLVDLLQKHPSIELPFELFLERCGPIRPRYYSISSSPLVDPQRLTLTVGVVQGTAWSGTGQYKGLTSSYLSRVAPGDTIYGYTRTPNPPFRPPADPGTPLILIGPGTGVAPLRGFLEDRALQAQRGAQVGPALLFSGSRHPNHDWYYRDELEAWSDAGLVELNLAFSRLDGHPHRYVQHAIAAAGDTVWQHVTNGAHIYLCGDGVRMAPAVRRALIELHVEQTGSTESEAQAWLANMQETGRYAEDVFAPSK